MRKGSFNIHIQSIHNRVKYSGEYCHYKATRKGSLNIHIQSIHKRVKYGGEFCDYLEQLENIVLTYMNSLSIMGLNIVVNTATIM